MILLGKVDYIYELRKDLFIEFGKEASRDFYIIKYTDSNAAIRVRRNRLFESEDKAIATMPADARSKRNSHWDYYQNH